MTGLSPEERADVVYMIYDAFMPYGREFDAEDAGRLVEARIEGMLNRARADAWERGHFYCAAESGDKRCENPWQEWSGPHYP